MRDSFYVADGGRFVSTELTRGPWDPDAQHAGPPAALIAREIERHPSPVSGPHARWQVGRITHEVVRPVPIAPLTLAIRVERPGRSVELLSAELRDAGGTVMRALAWRIAIVPIELPPGLASTEGESAARRLPDPAPPAAGTERPFFDTGARVGYQSAVETRFTVGSYTEPGPATVWMRQRVALVAGEEPTPLQRVLIAADSGNGVSATLDLARYLFINVDLTVHLHRMPVGEWICLEAITVPEPSGIGLADAMLHDQRGPIGRALQTLLVRER